MAKHCRARQLFSFDKDNAAFCAFGDDCHIKLIENINAEHGFYTHTPCRLLIADIVDKCALSVISETAGKVKVNTVDIQIGMVLCHGHPFVVSPDFFIQRLTDHRHTGAAVKEETAWYSQQTDRFYH